MIPSNQAARVPEASHRWKRAPGEHYVEPEWCSRRLFEVEKFEGGILDPAAGFGRIVDSARAAGFSAISSDIVDRGAAESELDFLGLHPEPIYDWWRTANNIVCNPPFDLFREFADRALAMMFDFRDDVAARKVAMIWTVRTLPAARWLDETPLARIWFLTPRPSMPPGCVVSHGVGLHGEPQKIGGGKQDFCWLVWESGHIGPAQIGWLRRDPATSA